MRCRRGRYETRHSRRRRWKFAGAPVPAIHSVEFRARVAELLDELAGDEGRLWVAVLAWWRRVQAESVE